MGGILFIHDGPDWARERFEEGRAYWSPGLPVVLEKHGYLNFTTRTAEALEDEEMWRAHDVVLLASLRPGTIDAEVVTRIAGWERPVLLDGPLPPEVASAVGVKDVGTLPLPAHGRLVADDGSRAPLNLPRLEPRTDAVRTLPTTLTSAQRSAWQATLDDARGWEIVGECDAVVHLAGEEEAADRVPAIVRRGPITGCAFGLFELLVRHHTSPPAPAGGTWRQDSTLALDRLFCDLIDGMYQRAGAVRPRVRPWPEGVASVRNIRHDVNEPLSLTQARLTIDAHRRLRTATTWYWTAGRGGGRPSLMDPRELVAAAVVSDRPAHEVALAAGRLEPGAAGQREVLESAVGQPLRGCTAAVGSGADAVLWAESEGLLYVDLPEHEHVHPHRFPALGPDGRVRLLDLICLPHPVAVDDESEIARRSDAGGFVQLVSPLAPDVARLQVQARGRVDWTAGDAADWWHRTHTGALTVESTPAGIELESRYDVFGVVIELLAPDGTATEEAIDLAAGERRLLHLP